MGGFSGRLMLKCSLMHCFSGQSLPVVCNSVLDGHHPDAAERLSQGLCNRVLFGIQGAAAATQGLSSPGRQRLVEDAV